MERITNLNRALNEELPVIGMEEYTPVQNFDEQVLHKLLTQLGDRRFSCIRNSVDDKEVASIRKMLADLLLLREGFDLNNKNQEKGHDLA